MNEITGYSNQIINYRLSLEDIPVSLVVFFIFILIIFVLWIASMIAMVNLNSRFKHFLDVYVENVKTENSDALTSSKPDISDADRNTLVK